MYCPRREPVVNGVNGLTDELQISVITMDGCILNLTYFVEFKGSVASPEFGLTDSYRVEYFFHRFSQLIIGESGSLRFAQFMHDFVGGQDNFLSSNLEKMNMWANRVELSLDSICLIHIDSDSLI